MPEDEWLLDPWIAKHHPHLHDGHHAQPLPVLQGSVFVAANFVYDCRQQYAMDPSIGASGWHPNRGTIAHRKSTGGIPEWGTNRGVYVHPRPALFRDDSGSRKQPEVTQFCAEDVNLNLQQLQNLRIPIYRNPAADEADEPDEETDDSDTESSHPQTTVAVDRPGLSVSGQRICILTGQDPDPVTRVETEHPEQGFISKVILKVNQASPPPLPKTAPPPLPPSRKSFYIIINNQ